MPEILTAKDIARYLGIGYVQALKLIKYRGIPKIRIGNSFRVYRKAFEVWLEENSK